MVLLVHTIALKKVFFFGTRDDLTIEAMKQILKISPFEKGDLPY